MLKNLKAGHMYIFFNVREVIRTKLKLQGGKMNFSKKESDECSDL